jgi:hypothetical protein
MQSCSVYNAPSLQGDKLETTESLAANRVNQFVAYTVNV